MKTLSQANKSQILKEITGTLQERTDKVLTETGLDFTVNKVPLYAYSEYGIIESDYFGLHNSKTNEIINTVKDSYNVSQNEDVVKLVFQGMRNFGNLSISGGGSMNGGRKIFLQLGIEGVSKVGDDVIEKFITVTDSNDCSSGLSVGIGNLTISCMNEFYKFNRVAKNKFRHSKSLQENMLAIPKLIEESLEESMQIIVLYNSMRKTKVSKRLAHKLVKSLVGISKLESATILDNASTRSVNSMNSLYDHIDKEMSQKGLNLWGLHSGTTSWTTHDKSVPKRENGRIESGMFGSNYKANQKSLAFAKELIKY